MAIVFGAMTYGARSNLKAGSSSGDLLPSRSIMMRPAVEDLFRGPHEAPVLHVKECEARLQMLNVTFERN